MGSLGSNYELVVLDRLLGSGSPATVYVALFTTVPPSANSTGVEVGGGLGYTAATVTNDATHWPAAFSSQKRNGAIIPFGTATASWGTVEGYGIFDDAVLRTVSHMICFGSVTPATVLAGGAPVQFDIGNLVVTAT